MKTSPVLSIFLIPVLCLFSACASLPVSDTPRAPLWAAPIYEDLLAAAKKAEGRPFDAVRETIEKRIDREPVFPAATEKIRSDELFLLSPRNTKVRPSSWNRAFIWNQAEGGRDYVLHVYSGDSEVLRRPMGSARRTMVTEHDAPFVPGAREFLESYHAKIPLYIVSATPESELIEIITARNMNRFFKGVYGSPKTKAEHLKNIIAAEEIPEDNTVYVGDAHNDCEAAWKSGVRFIGRVPPGSTATVFSRCSAVETTVRDLNELAVYLETILC